MFTAVSRTQDYHHNFSGIFQFVGYILLTKAYILAGTIIGVGCAWYAYHLYYPSLWHKDCHLPKLHSSKVTNDSPAEKQQNA
jgi:diacylglycerol diphosphate phosphatase/phosphatidate phosphatase